MKIYYAADTLPEVPSTALKHKVPNSIFLAGPTPRDFTKVESWREDAIKELNQLKFTGHLFIPETEGGGWHGNYNEQVLWEWRALGRAAATVFWVPRDLETLPGFTTNVEFGFMAVRFHDRLILGCPDGAPKTKYLKHIANHHDLFAGFLDLPTSSRIPIAITLEEALEIAVRRVT